jgi:hypothetical protein
MLASGFSFANFIATNKAPPVDAPEKTPSIFYKSLAVSSASC